MRTETIKPAGLSVTSAAASLRVSRWKGIGRIPSVFIPDLTKTSLYGFRPLRREPRPNRRGGSPT
jgi:hypothetical protein